MRQFYPNDVFRSYGTRLPVQGGEQGALMRARLIIGDARSRTAGPTSAKIASKMSACMLGTIMAGYLSQRATYQRSKRIFAKAIILFFDNQNEYRWTRNI